MAQALRPFQERALQHLMRGNNLILQVPTGGGKTRAALAPFLQHFCRNLMLPEQQRVRSEFPLTCRYATPLRSLANQFTPIYQEMESRLGPQGNRRLIETYKRFGQRIVQIQTGEQPNDPHFESALTFCTIDQLLASFLGIPYGVSTGRSNLNVGAVIGSYLVLDEFHLYPVEANGWGARTTALQMLALLNKQERLTPFTLMTATFSSGLLQKVAELLKAEIVSVSDKPGPNGEPSELDEIYAGRQRRFFVRNEAMQAHEIVDLHRDCTLVICNTVQRAQETYWQIRQVLAEQGRDSELILLHSRFSDEDRAAKQTKLEDELGSKNWNGNDYLGRDLIVVATQVVEVGLDISVRTLHSEIAPANSIIQRAGRCARFARQQGTVYLYPLPEGARALPYSKEACQATLDAFGQFNGQLLDFAREQLIIDAVHSGEDHAMLNLFERERRSITSKIFAGLGQQERSIASELIRNVQLVSVLIHPDPNSALTERPWDFQSFSLSPYSLTARWEKDLQQEDEIGLWKAEALEQSTEEGNRLETRYSWKPIKDKNEIPLALMLCLSPTVASYDKELGFQVRNSNSSLPWQAGNFISQLRPQQKRARSFAPYKQESYLEHIRGLLRAFQNSRLQDELSYVGSRLEALFQLPAGTLHKAVRIAIACHDIGKLSQGWQSWANTWQSTLFQSSQDEQYQPRKAPFAHTDYDPRAHFELSKSIKPKRPNHAGESAFFASQIIYELLCKDFADPKDQRLQILYRAMIAAIVRHHNAKSTSYTPQTLIPDAQRHIEAALQEVLVLNGSLQAKPKPIKIAGEFNANHMTKPREERPEEAWLYFLFARILRLADGRSFEFKEG